MIPDGKSWLLAVIIVRQIEENLIRLHRKYNSDYYFIPPKMSHLLKVKKTKQNTKTQKHKNRPSI